MRSRTLRWRPGPSLLPILALAAAAISCGGEASVPVAPRQARGLVVLVGPRFWTGEPARPWSEALAVRDGRIEDFPERHEVAGLVAAGARRIDLPGEVAVPGLVDAHGHLLGFGLAERRVNLVGTRSLEQALSRVAAWRREHPDDPVILGRGWDQNDWPRRAFPDADRLDQVVPDRPCLLARIDGHAMWVNRAALAATGIDASTPDPPGGEIRRDRTGRPTGILIDAAMDLVASIVPEPGEKEIRAALVDSLERLAGLGLTGFHDMGIDSRTLAVLEDLARQRRLPLRLTLYASAGDEALVGRLLDQGPITGDRWRLIGVKFYADGALGSRGARLLEDYADRPGHRGLFVTDPRDLRRDVLRTMDAGLQPAIHAIGDAANRLALDIYGEGLARLIASRAEAGLALRPRIEHAQVIAPGDIPRFRGVVDDALEGRADAGSWRGRVAVIASMQPVHATSDMPWAESRLGRHRLAGAYAWRSLIDAGVPLAFGSDAPVENPDPRLGLYAAITRQDLQGRPPGGWLPAQRIPLDRAIRAYTLGAAFAAGTERDEGTLAPGKRCDLTVLRVDPFRIEPRDLPDDPVLLTVIDGEPVEPRAGR